MWNVSLLNIYIKSYYFLLCFLIVISTGKNCGVSKFEIITGNMLVQYSAHPRYYIISVISDSYIVADNAQDKYVLCGDPSRGSPYRQFMSTQSKLHQGWWTPGPNGKPLITRKRQNLYKRKMELVNWSNATSTTLVTIWWPGFLSALFIIKSKTNIFIIYCNFIKWFHPVGHENIPVWNYSQL